MTYKIILIIIYWNEKWWHIYTFYIKFTSPNLCRYISLNNVIQYNTVTKMKSFKEFICFQYSFIWKFSISSTILQEIQGVGFIAIVHAIVFWIFSWLKTSIIIVWEILISYQSISMFLLLFFSLLLFVTHLIYQHIQKKTKVFF